MRASWARAGRYGRYVAEPLLVLAAVAALRPAGLTGDAPLWLFAAVLVATEVWAHPGVQRRLSGGDPGRGLWWRVGGHIGLATALIYLVGWGSLLAVVHLRVLSEHLTAAGSRAWRPAAAASAGALALGQAATAAGLVHSHLPSPLVHVLAVVVGLTLVATARLLGAAVARREHAEAALRTGEARARALVRDGSEVIVCTDAAGDASWVSPAALPTMGYPPSDLLGATLRDLVHPADARTARALHERLLADDGTTEHAAEVRVRHADGTWHWHEVTARNMLADPDVRAVVWHHRDVTTRREAQDRMAHAAAHDPLTGLANAATLRRDLGRALAAGTRYRDTVALLFLDLDGFKQVNDTVGHEAGDRLLARIGELLRGAVRETDAVGRLGGDEFAVVLTRVGGPDEALAVGRRVVRAIAGDPAVSGLDVPVGCSVGVALAHPGGTDERTLLRNADTAMYRAKRRGRNGVELFRHDDVVAPWQR